MTPTRRAALSLGASAPLAAPAVLRAQDRRRLIMVTAWPRNLPGPGESAQRIADDLTRLSGGRLRVELYAAGELVPAFEVLDAVSGGVAQLGHAAAAFWAGRMPVAPLFLSAPFGLTPLEHNAWIEAGGGQALWDRLYADLGLKPFMAGNTGMSMGGWFRQPLESRADLRGLKMRIAGLGASMYQPLGVVPVTLAPGDILPGLQAGTIDAAEFAGPHSDLALGLYQAAPVYHWPGIHEPNGTGELLVGTSLWDGLDAEMQGLIATVAAAENARALAVAERRNAQALSALTAEGATLARLPDAVIEAARANAQDVIADLAQDATSRAVVESYRAALQAAGRWPGVSIQGFLAARGVVG